MSSGSLERFLSLEALRQFWIRRLWILCWFRTIPESLVWLIAKGRTAEAEAILQRAARMNGRRLPANCLHDDVAKQETAGDRDAAEGPVTAPANQRTYTVIDLVRTPNLRKITLCISGLWWVRMCGREITKEPDVVLEHLSILTWRLYGRVFRRTAGWKFVRRWQTCDLSNKLSRRDEAILAHFMCLVCASIRYLCISRHLVSRLIFIS